MQRTLIISSLAVALSPLLAWSEKSPARYKSIEVRHFATAEGVELPPNFPDLLYAEVRKRLQKSGRYGELISENEVVDSADASRSLLLEGKVLTYKKGSAVKARLGIGGRRNLVTQVTVRRRSDNGTLFDKTLSVKASGIANPNFLATFVAKKIASELKGKL